MNKDLSLELKYIDELRHKYYKMFMEYNEVGRNALKMKYEHLYLLMDRIESLINDGYKYRDLIKETLDSEKTRW